MFNFLKKKTKEEQLQKRYEELMKEAYVLSRSSRAKSDEKYAEAYQVMQQIEALRNGAAED